MSGGSGERGGRESGGGRTYMIAYTTLMHPTRIVSQNASKLNQRKDKGQQTRRKDTTCHRITRRAKTKHRARTHFKEFSNKENKKGQNLTKLTNDRNYRHLPSTQHAGKYPCDLHTYL